MGQPALLLCFKDVVFEALCEAWEGRSVEARCAALRSAVYIWLATVLAGCWAHLRTQGQVGFSLQSPCGLD